MQSENHNNEIAEILMLIKAAWPQFTANQGRVYRKMLDDVPIPVLHKAVEACVRESRFLPTIAEIREKAEAVYKQAKGIESPDASRAWGEVMREISHTGSYGKPKFTDPLTTEAVKRMGWRSICNADISTTSVQRAQFIKIYDTIEKRKTEERRMGFLLSDGKLQAFLGGIADMKALPGKIDSGFMDNGGNEK